MKRIILLPFIVLTLIRVPDPVVAQIFTSEEEAGKRVEFYTRYMDLRKVYLHLNKNNYQAGDAIWFQAYLMDGMSHTPDTSSTNLYVELINREGVLMAKRVLLADRGIAEGDIVLPYDIPDGNYLVRAYTDWMRNFDEQFYYSRHLYIHNPGYADIIPRSEIRSNRRFNNMLEDYSRDINIAFFPEGGQMIAGIPLTLAFKAVDRLGKGVEVKGEITGENEVVAVFESNRGGVGSFEFTPVAGTTYTASVSFEGGSSQSFNLPEVMEEGATLRVKQDEKNLNIDIYSAGPSGLSGYDGDVVLIAHTRGNVIYAGNHSLDGGRTVISLPREGFPSGIAHLTLFSDDFVPLSERLVFVDHKDGFVFYPEVVIQVIGDREYYVMNLNVTNKHGEPVEGNFSLSVLQDQGGNLDFQGSILSYMLASSDLPGITQEVHNYLNPELDMAEELDNLMLTHGWRRFVWDDVLSGNLPGIEHRAASSLAITGKVIHPATDRAVPNFPVSLDIRGEDDLNFETRTDNDGNFHFDNLIFHDETNIRISSDRLISRSPPEYEINSGELTGIDYIPGINTLPQQITRRGDQWSRTPGAGASPYSRVRDDGTTPSQYGVADQTVFIDPEPRQTTMYDILISRVRGLNHNLQFRGPTSMHLSNTPIFLLDGSEIGRGVFLALDPRYIQRIEVFSGPRASVFGVRGAAGAILAYTRRPGDTGMPDYEEYLIQGYHSAREFYSDFMPLYNANAREGVPARTVYWATGLVSDDSGHISITVPVPAAAGTLIFIVEGAGFNEGMGFGVFLVKSSH